MQSYLSVLLFIVLLLLSPVPGLAGRVARRRRMAKQQEMFTEVKATICDLIDNFMPHPKNTCVAVPRVTYVQYYDDYAELFDFWKRYCAPPMPVVVYQIKHRAMFTVLAAITGFIMIFHVTRKYAF
jgi:hypothetical protein